MRKLITMTALAALMGAPAFAQVWTETVTTQNSPFTFSGNEATTGFSGATSSASVGGGSSFSPTGAFAHDSGVSSNFTESANTGETSTELGSSYGQNTANGFASPAASFSAGGTDQSFGTTAANDAFYGSNDTTTTTYAYYWPY